MVNRNTSPRSRTRLVPSISERGKKKELIAPGGSVVRAAVPSAGAGAASGNVCPLDDAAEPFVAGVVVAPDDVAADHAGVVGPVEREVPQGAVNCASMRFNQDEFVGVQAISTLFAAARAPTRPSLAVV